MDDKSKTRWGGVVAGISIAAALVTVLTFLGLGPLHWGDTSVASAPSSQTTVGLASVAAPPTVDPTLTQATVVVAIPSTTAVAASPPPDPTPAPLVPTTAQSVVVTVPLSADDATDYGGLKFGQPNEAKINGTQFESSIIAAFTCGDETKTMVLDLNRTASRFFAVAGVEDFSPEETEMTFSVYGDSGERLWGPTVAHSGESHDIDLDATGILHLRLQVVGQAACLGSNEYGAFGDPRVLRTVSG